MDVEVNAVVLSRDPLIIVVANGPQDRFLGDARLIAEYYGLTNFILLVSPQFSIWEKPNEDKLLRVKAVNQFKKDYQKSDVFYLCNEDIEMEVFKGTDISTIHVNQNAFIDENLFYPSNEVKKFDAIYVGQLQPFKRHKLARLIESIAFVYYGKDYKYLSEIIDAVPHAEILNGLPEELGGAGKRSLRSWEMAQAYNQSRVGLCLSAVEGAMYASTEYLLCGIPVVTTHNVGGRNDFLDSMNSLTVDADEVAIVDAVQHFLRYRPSAHEIRSNTLKRIHDHRRRFFKLIDGFFADSGQNQRSFEKEFGRIFHDKLWKSRCPLHSLLR
jgi:glycosyltransferase involved in cell wall biosynthesis